MTDWFAILLDDEDGHPAALLRKLDIGWEAARSVAFDEPAHQRPGPTPDAAVVRSRELSIALRGDPTPTTDMLFLAILEAAEAIGGGFASLGAGLSRAALLYQLPAEESEPAPVATVFTIADSAGRDSTARILDAALNRARESLRVLDDYARFALNDRILTEDVKSLRHDLAAAGEQLPKRHLLAFRDTGNDVGTRLEAPAEYRRETPNHVASVNLKRLQEALRSIEEYGKIHGASFARAIEQIRYRAYTLEQAICSRDTATPRLAEARLYLLLTGSQCQHSLDWTIREAAAGGTDIVQLREKALTDRDLLSRARLIRHWTRESGLLFIVNDRPDIARLCDADGVHLGQDDPRRRPGAARAPVDQRGRGPADRRT
jgi:thiamine-phosphate pyrophosphorylase